MARCSELRLLKSGEDESSDPQSREAVRPETAAPTRDDEVLALCEGLIDVAAALFSVSSKELRRPGRTALAVSRVRQIAMYVGHVTLGLSMREVGQGFGRDRTTVVHACHLIEDMRDDPDFDRHVSLTERVVLAAFRAKGNR